MPDQAAQSDHWRIASPRIQSTENEARRLALDWLVRETTTTPEAIEAADALAHKVLALSDKDAQLTRWAENRATELRELAEAKAKLEQLQQEQEHPFDASEFRIMAAKLREYEEALQEAAIALDGAGCQVAASQAHRALTRSNGEEG